MYRILIVDDEPLILAGISSMITWENYDCTIVGKATNGPSAHKMILELHPDIVITDIRMPAMNGLELVEACKNDGCSFAFIVLTNLEEFPLVKKALSLGASDYLVKIEMNEEAIVKALERAKESCRLLASSKNHELYTTLIKDKEEDLLKNGLRHLLIDNDSNYQFSEEILQKYLRPFVMVLSATPSNINCWIEEKRVHLQQIQHQIQEIVGGIASRFFQSYCLMEYGSNSFLFVASLRQESDFFKTMEDFCPRLTIALKTYFELSAVYGISTLKSCMSELPAGLKEALIALEYYYYDSTSPIVFYNGQHYHVSSAKKFNINMFKKDISSSISQNDSARLEEIFNKIICLFSENKPGKEQATSACINIYTYLYSFFETDDNSYEDIFPYTMNIAEQLNHFNSLSDILTWLQSFCGKLCQLLYDRKSTRSDKLVEQAKAYIEIHYKEKLTLSDISENLNISASHLSSTFKKLTGITLSDYIAHAKIEHAKELIDTHKFLMYEISDILGFDNPYYFSKVFKKVTGISPREYESRRKYPS